MTERTDEHEQGTGAPDQEQPAGGDSDSTSTDHPTGDAQAAENAEREPPG